jgi:ribosomal protein S18 acetylase RimI-like enzyme
MSKSDSIQGFRIRSILESDLPELAELHGECFPGSFLARLGTSTLGLYLGWLVVRTRNRPCTLVAVDDSGIIGYLSAGCFTENVHVSFMKEHRLRLALGILLRPRVMFHPDFKTKVHRAWIGLRRYGADSKAAPNLTKDPVASTKKWSKARFHILSVAVSPRGRRRGIGSALLSEGMIEARARDCAFMDAAVAASNSASLGLFTGFGFEILDPTASSIQVKYILG